MKEQLQFVNPLYNLTKNYLSVVILSFLALAEETESKEEYLRSNENYTI